MRLVGPPGASFRAGPVGSGRGPTRILVVEDDRAVQDMLTDLLRSAGYETAACKDGKQALADLTSETFDLLLLDMLIPKMNGFALVEQVRATPSLRDLPIIMMSGIYKSRNHRNEMTNRFGVVDYLDKPLHPGALLELIKKTVGAGAQPVVAALAPPPYEELTASMTKKPATQASRFSHDSAALMAQADALAAEADELISKSRARPRAGVEPPTFDERLVDRYTREEKEAVESAARREFPASAFIIQGSLRVRSVASVLGNLSHARATGALLLRREKVKKIIYLRDGDPVHVKSNLINECLGQILLRERLIGEDDLAWSIERMRESGKKQGEILVDRGALTDKNLEFALSMQTERKLFETFAWDQGEFRFNASAGVAPGSDYEMPGPALVAEGIRRSFDETRLRNWMLPVIEVPLKLRGTELEWSRLQLSARERQAVEGMDLPATTRVLIEALPLEPPDSLRLVFTLVALEILVPAR